MSDQVHLVHIQLSVPDPNNPSGSRHVDLGPALYDLAGDHAPRRPSAEDAIPADFAHYLQSVLHDADALISDVVGKYAAEWAHKTHDPTAQTSFSSDRERPQIHDLYVRLLVDLARHHRDLLLNLLAALLCEQVQVAAADPALTPPLAETPAPQPSPPCQNWQQN